MLAAVKGDHMQQLCEQQQQHEEPVAYEVPDSSSLSIICLHSVCSHATCSRLPHRSLRQHQMCTLLHHHVSQAQLPTGLPTPHSVPGKVSKQVLAARSSTVK